MSDNSRKTAFFVGKVVRVEFLVILVGGCRCVSSSWPLSPYFYLNILLDYLTRLARIPRIPPDHLAPGRTILPFFSADVIEDAKAMFNDRAYRRLAETGFPDYDKDIPRFVDADEEEEELPPPRWRRPAYDYDDDEEEYEEPEAALRYALRRIESIRYSIENERANLQALLRNNPQLAAKWQEFAAGGGISADDFEAFLNGKFRVRLGARTRRHLRLISNRRPPPIRLRRRQNDDPPDEAA